MSDSNTILVVDDTLMNLELVIEFLSLERYTVWAATSGEQALKRLQTERPALILLDIQMPDMDGFETCRRIKANPETACIPIIFMTAFSDKQKMAEGFSLGAVDYVTKPVQEVELLARVKTHIQLNALTQNLEQQVSAHITELKALEARQRKRFETSPIGLALCRMDGSLVDVNAAYAAIIGRTIPETLALTYWEITPETYAADEQVQLKSLEETGQYGPYEKEYLHKEGHLVPVRLSGVILEQDGEQFIWSSVEDISDRKAAEADLRASEQRYATLAAAAPVGIFRADASGTCIYVNDRWCHIAGLTSAAAMGDGWLQGVHPEDRDRVATKWDQSTQEQRPFQLEYRFQRPDGSVSWVYGQSVAEQDDAGQIMGYVGTITDITDRKHSEIALQASEAHQRALLRAIPDLIMRVDRDGYYLEFVASPNFRVLGHLTDWIGIHVTTDLPPEAAQQRITAIQNALETRKIQIYEQTLPIDGGGEQFEEVRVVPYGEDEVLLLVRDISERKRLEAERKHLEQEQKKLNAILESASDYISTATPEGNTLWFNQQFKTILPPTQSDEPSQYKIPDFHPQWAYEIVAGQGLPTAIQEGTWLGETAILDRAGREIPVSQLIIAHKDNAGEVEYFSTVMRDISERKRNEEILQQQLTAIEASSEGIAITNQQGEYTYLNDAHVQIFGYQHADELLGKNWHVLYQPSQIKWLEREIFPQLTQTRAWRGEVMAKRQDGSLFTEELSLTLLPDNRIICVCRDVSDRKAAEDNLRASEQRFRQAIENAPFPIMIHAENGKILQINSTWTELTGYTHVDIPTITDWAQRAYGEQASKVLQDKIAQKYILTSLWEEGEFIINTRDGGQCLWEFRSAPLAPLTDGRRVVISMAVDVTQKRQAEVEREQLLSDLSELNQELEQANQQLTDYSQTLEQRVAERTQELSSSIKQLKATQAELIYSEKMAALGRLITGIAHELRNPLNFVKNYAEGSIELSQELFDELQPIIPTLASESSAEVQTLIADLQENATTICHQSRRAEQIIETMMQHSHTDAERATLQPTEIHDLLDQAIKLSSHGRQNQRESYNLKLRKDYADNLKPINTVPSSLIRAFINLIDNAIDAMQFKQSQLQIDAPEAAMAYEPTLSVSTRSPDAQVEICIRDNGCGIDTKIRSQVLDPFFTTKPPGKGTGLGLSLTHDIIVEQHQGTFMINSSLGEFTEIVLTLPQN